MPAMNLERGCWVTFTYIWSRTSTKQSLQWRHNHRDGVSNHQPHDCILNRLFRRRSNKKMKSSALRVLCEGNSPVTGEFPTQRTRNAEKVSIWWRLHDYTVISRVSGTIQCMRPANKRRRYIVTSSFIGWAYTRNDPWGISWNRMLFPSSYE